MMADSRKEILKKLNQHRLFSLLLGLSLLYFVYKGLVYFFLGSYIPLLVIALILGLLFYGLKKSPAAFRRTIGFWCVLLLLWSSVRLLLGIVNQFVKPIPEAHVSGQLGITGTILSLAFLVTAVVLWRSKNKVLN